MRLYGYGGEGRGGGGGGGASMHLCAKHVAKLGGSRAIPNYDEPHMATHGEGKLKNDQV